MYEIILLDADGTLFDYDKAEEVALKKALSFIGVNSGLDEIRERYRAINSALWLELEQGKITKDQLKFNRFSWLFAEFDISYSAKDFSLHYSKYLGEGSYLLCGAEELCRELSKKHKLVILTNGMKEVQLARLSGSTIKQFIHQIVISEEVGVSKPNPYIFEHTLNTLNHSDKSSVLMVGDSLTSDIQGGLNSGIDTCWYNPNNAKNELEIKPKYEISELNVLHNILR